MNSPLSPDPLSPDIQLRTVPQPRGHRGSRRRGDPHSSPYPAGPPDLAAVARAAVIGFLRDERAATAERDATLAGAPAADAKVVAATTAGMTSREGAPDAAGIFPAADETLPAAADPAAGESASQAVARRAAATSLATLDRIELAAAKLEADIAAARKEQAEVRAGAGAAAESAILAAQEAWLAAVEAEKSSAQARDSVRRIGRYMGIFIVIVVLQLLFAGAFASVLH